MSLLSRLFGRKAAPATPAKHARADMVSLVALASTWREISVDDVRGSLDALFPGEFLPPREEGNFVIEGPAPGATFVVQCNVPGSSGMFLIHNVPGPYSEFSDFLSHVTDPSMRALALAQTCWMSVDLMHRHTTDEEAYRFVSTVLAQLVPDDTAMVMHPTTYQTVRLSPDVRRILAAGGSPYGSA